MKRRTLLENVEKIPTNVVNLGLPSGILWAQGNIVKSSNVYSIGQETSYGTYFSWGNVVGHNGGEGYKFDSAEYNSSTGKNADSDITANTTYDAARVCLGSPWRMPTSQNFNELYNNCDYEYTTINGVEGRKFMKKSDHSIYVFFPFAGSIVNTGTVSDRGNVGYYWSSTYSSNSSANGYMVYYKSFGISQYSRSNGYSVRPVIDTK